MVNDLDDLEPPRGLRAWRGRLIAAGVVLVVAAAGAYALWTTTLKSSASAPLKTQTQAVARGTIRQTVSTTGTVSAQSSTSLSFQETGRVTAVNVKLGQQVKQGDVLAQVDTTDLQNAVQSAEANLTSAQVKLHQLEEGATASDLASADQSVAQAQAAYDKANSDLATLTGPPAAADEDAANSAVTAAQSQLNQAQSALTTLLGGPDASDLAAAQAAVTSAQSALASAQNGEENAQNGVTSAQASLFASESGYCAVDMAPQFCGVRAAPLSDGDRALLLGVTQTPVALPTGTPQAGGGGSQTIASLAAAVLGSNGSYESAANSAENASGAVTSAQAALSSAQAKLSALQAGPAASAVAAAQAAVTVAQDGLDAANAKLATLNGGPTQADLTAAQDAANSAAAGLKAAQAKRDLTAQGSTADDIRLQETSVQLAQLNVASAQASLKKAEIIAPYDGTVASLNVHVGDMAGSGGGSSTGATASASSSSPIVIDTPDAVQLQLTLGESDVAQVKVGDRGVATFDAMPGQSFPFTIDSIGGVPAVSQGVVTYTAQATMLTGAAALAAGFGPGASLSGPGSFGRGGGLSAPGRAGGFAQRTPRAGRTPGAARTPFAGRTPGAQFGGGGGAGLGEPAASETPAAKPLPGMSASAIIEVQQVTDVLLVPATAVKRQGLNSVVDVMQTDGTTKTVAVQTGLTDGTNIEITEGVNEGDKVVLPSLAASSSGTTNVSTTTGGRGGGGGGGRFGGFGGAGGGIAAPSNGIPGGVR